MVVAIIIVYISVCNPDTGTAENTAAVDKVSAIIQRSAAG